MKPHGARIHADDLAAIAVQAGSDNAPAGIYNVSDDQPTSITGYLYQLADMVGLPRPDCASLAEARRIFSPRMREYLVDNRRMKAILGVQLRYPTLSLFHLVSLTVASCHRSS